jgi:hypothetical protein
MTDTPPTTTPDAPEKRKKSYIFIGFFTVIGILVLLSWLAIQAVAYLPGAFSSLANLAESLQAPRNQELAITADRTEAPSGEAVTLSWPELGGLAGTFTISYRCADDLALELIDGDSAPRELRCDTSYSIAEATTARLRGETSSTTTTDVAIAFLRTNDTTPRREGTVSLTITPSAAVVVTPLPETPATPLPNEIASPAPTPEPAPPATPRPTPPRTTTVITMPVSDPRGSTDLAVRLVAVGTVSATDQFTPKTTLTRNARNAVIIEVMNLGTKTSERWGGKIDLPGDSTYELSDQKPLRPQERAVFTVRFSLESGSPASLEALVTTRSDSFTLNNRLQKTFELSS